MARFVHARMINVSIWGRRVGTIIPSPKNGYYAFRYDKSFVESGIQIAPISMPLAREPYFFGDLPIGEYYGLPPAFADSLPDSFGSGLIDAWLRSKGLVRQEITALDRLAYIGRRGIGALTYEPEQSLLRSGSSALDMRILVEEAKSVLNGELAREDGASALRHIIRVGSSAGGAQAKAVVGWNSDADTFMLGDCDLPEGFDHWMVKFTPQEYPWRGEREYEIYLRARDAGINVSESRLCELDGIKHFMTRRFDRCGRLRHHVQTLSAMSNFPMSVPLEFRTYERLFATAEELHLGYESKEELFRRMAFNVAVGECDDHTKNFSFILTEGGEWKLTPAYDLTGGSFPSADPWAAHIGRHQLSVNGKFSDIGERDLLAVAERFAIGTAERILKEVFSL